MSSPNLDVILPFHRLDQYLIDAIDSVMNSSYEDFRLILVDDRPNNYDSIDINKISKKLREYTYLKTIGGIGYGASLALGTEVLKAPYVAFMDSDDLIDRNRFNLQLKTILDCDISICGIQKIDKHGNYIPSLMGKLQDKNYHPLLLLIGPYGADSTWLMKTEWWIKNSFFDNDFALDWRIAMKAFPEAKISYIDKKLYFYREHSKQYSKTQRSKSSYNRVYEEWYLLGLKYSVDYLNRNTFDLLVIPEKKGTQYLSNEFRNFLKSYFSLINKNKLPISINSISELIERRIVIHAFTHTSKLFLLLKITREFKKVFILILYEIFLKFITKYFRVVR